MLKQTKENTMKMKFKSKEAQQEFVKFDVQCGSDYSHNQHMVNRFGMEPFDVILNGDFLDVEQDFTIHIETEGHLFEAV